MDFMHVANIIVDISPQSQTPNSTALGPPFSTSPTKP